MARTSPRTQAQKNPELLVESLAVDGLIPYAKNAREHSAEQVSQIAKSITAFGFNNPVLVDQDLVLVAGHGRVLAAKELGLKAVPAIRLPHMTAAQRRAYRIADNQIALNSTWDRKALEAELRELKDLDIDLSLLGFDLAALDFLEQGEDEEEVPPVEKVAVTRTGDLWRLGPHLLLCADCTAPGWFEQLFPAKSRRADLCWTDPPYNIAYETKAGSIANDDLSAEDFLAFLRKSFATIFNALRPGGIVYVAHSDTEGASFRRAFVDAGLKLSQCVIWRKDAFVIGRSDYQWCHEPILYGWKPGTHRWVGGRRQTTIADWLDGSPFEQIDEETWQVVVGDRVLRVKGTAHVEDLAGTVLEEPRPQRSPDHPTMKPVGLIARMLRNHLKISDVVFDPFGGSGSTLMAADQLFLSARLIELSGVYCDVIVRRWENATGENAVLVATGKTFKAVAKARARQRV